jgi:hypothetical protein
MDAGSAGIISDFADAGESLLKRSESIASKALNRSKKAISSFFWLFDQEKVALIEIFLDIR